MNPLKRKYYEYVAGARCKKCEAHRYIILDFDGKYYYVHTHLENYGWELAFNQMLHVWNNTEINICFYCYKEI